MTSFHDAELGGWTARAASYDQFFVPITSQIIGPVVAILGALNGMRVLDVACGPGHVSAALAAKGAIVEGIDFAPTMVARARDKHPAVRFREGDAEALPYGEGSFDHVVCAFGVMHFSNADRAIAE